MNLGTRVKVYRDLKAEEFPVPSFINMVGIVIANSVKGRIEVKFDLRPNPAWFSPEELVIL